MEWRTGDMIDVCREIDADGIVFTANSVISNNALVMGGGAAKRVRDYFPKSVPVALAKQIVSLPSRRIQPDYYLAGVTFMFQAKPDRPFYIFALQVKRDFKEIGDLQLTTASLQQLSQWCTDNPGIRLVLNCPLIGLGGFANQIDEVKRVVEETLNDTNVVVTII